MPTMQLRDAAGTEPELKQPALTRIDGKSSGEFEGWSHIHVPCRKSRATSLPSLIFYSVLSTHMRRNRAMGQLDWKFQFPSFSAP